MRDELLAFFSTPRSPRQRQYEALRAYAMEGLSAKQAARRFGFTEKTLFALAHDLRTGELDLFPKKTTGPRDRRVTPYVRDRACQLRKENLSVAQIAKRLREENMSVSPSTVERIVKDAGFGRLKRRTASQRGLSTKNTLLPRASQNLDVGELEPFQAQCQVAGLFFFLPYIIESGLMDVLEELPLPESGQIGKRQAFLSFLALKLMGGRRFCHVRQYDHDAGLGTLAGLNVLPKPTYMETYSCLLSAELCRDLQ